MSRCTSLSIALVSSLAACSHTVPRGVAAPSASHVIEARALDETRLDPAGLTHLLRGLYFLHSGHAAAAIPHLRLALVYDPASAFIHDRLARAWGSSGRRDRARHVLENGLARRPNDPWLNWLAGELALAARRFQDAVPHLARAVEAEEASGGVAPAASPAYIDALLWTGGRDAALRAATDFMKRRPADAGLALGLAARLEDHGELEPALEAYRAARARRPADRAAGFGEMRVLMLRGRLVEAANALVPLVGFYPDEPELLLQITRLMHRAGREDAAAYRREALRQTGGDRAGRTAVAVADLMEGRQTAGLQLLHEVVAAAPADVNARSLLAEALFAQGDAGGCLQVLDAAQGVAFHRQRAWCLAAAGKPIEAGEQIARELLRSDRPRDLLVESARLLARTTSEAMAQELLNALFDSAGDRITEADRSVTESVLAAELGHGARAIELLESVVAREHGAQASDRVESEWSDSDLAFRLADLYSRHGRLPEAIAMLERLLDEEPGAPLRLNALGYTLADAGQRLDEAAVWLRRAHRLSPDDGYVIDSLGWVMFRLGDVPTAIALLKVAANVARGDAEILYHLGIAYRAAGDEEAAERAFAAALRAHPSPTLRAVLQRCVTGKEGS